MEQMRIEHGILSAGVYCRLSKDDEQAGDSTSIQTQKMMLEKYCFEQGYPIYSVYADDGFSGLNFNRPAFNRLIEDIDSGKVNLVITKDLSRLGCDYIQTGYYTDVYFSRKRVRYIAVNDNIDTSRDDYEQVQQLISQRHRPKKHSFDNLFKDLTFCSECGHRMTLMMKPLKVGLTPVIRCMNRFNNPEQCQHYHYIYHDDLYAEVLKRVQAIAKKVQSGELLENVQKQAVKQVKAERLEAEKIKLERRLQALRKIIKKLYEEFACDLLEADGYHDLLTEYTQEQKQITVRLTAIESELERKDSYVQGVEKLRAMLDEYLNVDTLIANMLNQLIERIEIGLT